MQQEETLYLKKLTGGDMDAFKWFFDRYHEKVYHYCRKLVLDSRVAEELTSDVFMRLWKKRFLIEEKGSVNGLLSKIARDLCIDHLRKVARKQELSEVFLRMWDQASVPSASSKVEFEECINAVDRAILTLPPKRREVFQLRYREDLSNQQIASVLGISPNTVKVHLVKATKHLRRHLQMHSDLELAVLIFYLLQ